MSRPNFEFAHSGDAIPMSSMSAKPSASTQAAPERPVVDDLAITETKEPSKLDGSYNVHATTTYLSERNKQSLQSLETSNHTGTRQKDIPDIRLEELAVGLSEGETRTLTNISDRVHVNQKRNSLIQFLSLCYCLGMVGWNDGTAGPLLPTLQEYYKVCGQIFASCTSCKMTRLPCRLALHWCQ